MKKYTLIMTIILAMAVAFSLTACGSSDGGASDSGAAEADGPKTMADVYALDIEDETMSISEDKVVYIYTIDSVPTRVEASITEDMYNEVNDIPYDEDGRDEMIQSILGPAEITRIDDLSDTVPTEDEVNALIGKTGKDLADEGFNFQSCMVNGKETTVTADKNYGAYMITFKGKVNEEDEGWKDELAGLKVTEAYYSGVDYSAVSDFK